MNGRHPEPTRVLWLSKGLGPGGAERLLLSFAQVADRERFDISAAYLLPWKAHLTDSLEEAGVPTRCISKGKTADLRWLVALRRLVARERIDVVHIHSPMVGGLARPALRAMPRSVRPAIVTTEHNEWSSFHVGTRTVNALSLPLSDATLAVSAPVRDSMPRRLQAGTEVVIHGVDVAAILACRSERAAVRSELGIADDVVVVGTVANLRAGKDYPTLLRAARKVADLGLPVRFLSVGQGQLEEDLHDLHARLGLGDRFRFLGYQADPVRIMSAFDVFSLCSEHEGLSIALVEALVLGLPAIVTPVGGVPSVVRDGVEGRHVAVGEPDSIVSAIEELLDPATRGAMAQRAASRGREYEVADAVERQQDLYEKLATDRRYALTGSRR